MKKFSIEKNKIKEYLFFGAFIIYLFFTILNASFYAKYIPGLIYKSSFVIELIILIIKEIITTKLKFREWIYLLIIILLTGIIYINLSGQFPILLLFVFIYSSRNVDLKKIVNIAYYESLLLFIFIVISSKIGFIPNYIEYGSRVREYLGFRYSLYSQALLFNIISLDLYRNKENKKHSRYIFWFLISYITFHYNNSRLSFYLSLLLILLSAFLTKYSEKIKEKKHILIGALCCLSYLICFSFSLYITYNYNPLNNNYYELNEYLGNRLYYGNNALQEYKVNLFGHDINLVGNGLDSNGIKNTATYNYVDCLYIILLLRYGLVFMIIFMAILTSTNIYLYRKKEYYILLVMVIYAFHGIIDDLMIYLYYNTFWLVIGSMILNKNRIKNKLEV